MSPHQSPRRPPVPHEALPAPRRMQPWPRLCRHRSPARRTRPEPVLPPCVLDACPSQRHLFGRPASGAIVDEPGHNIEGLPKGAPGTQAETPRLTSSAMLRPAKNALRGASTTAMLLVARLASRPCRRRSATRASGSSTTTGNSQCVLRDECRPGCRSTTLSLLANRSPVFARLASRFPSNVLSLL